jgi:hypothetical protein
MSDQSRRKILKSIAAGSGAIVAGKSLPESWSRPVVDSVLLPAHAQTSDTANGPFAGTATTQVPALKSDSIFAQATDSLVPQAHAADGFEPYVCVQPNSTNDAATVTVLVDNNGPRQYLFTNVPLNGNSCDYIPVKIACPVVGDAGDLLRDFGLIKDAHALPETVCCYLDSVSGVGAGRVTFSEGHGDVEFSVGPNECNPPDVCSILTINL